MYFLPSLATLGNLICGFGAIYIATLMPWPEGSPDRELQDPWAVFFADHRFATACYLILIAMLFDAVDGQLARFTRHTTDFGGQLDSLADVVSFGVAPAIIMLHVFKLDAASLPLLVSRAVWAIAALYVACAAMRLARFNVANDAGNEDHQTFQGMPSPGAAATVVAFVLMQQTLRGYSIDSESSLLHGLFYTATALLPAVVLGTGLLMISNVRYPHFASKFVRYTRSLTGMVLALAVILGLIVVPTYTLAAGTMAYALSGPAMWVWRWRKSAPTAG